MARVFLEPICPSKNRQSLCQPPGYLCVNVSKAPLPLGLHKRCPGAVSDNTTYTAMWVGGGLRVPRDGVEGLTGLTPSCP